MSYQPTKKSLGQHWLHDKSMLVAMCVAAGVSADDTVLEIGPGTGELTQVLLDTGASVVALEIDESLHPILRSRFGDYGDDQFNLAQGDIRTYDLRELPQGYKIVANIPYYLTSHLVRILSESVNPPNIATLLVQKEVAERICATPGSMSLLSVTSQVYWECSLAEIVPAALFTPAPKVDSQIVVLKRRLEPLVSGDLHKPLFRLVKAGFSNRRKTLENSLSAGFHVDKATVKSWLEASGIKSGVRAQELSIQEWITLGENISS